MVDVFAEASRYVADNEGHNSCCMALGQGREQEDQCGES
jgi:hypothetical protein